VVTAMRNCTRCTKDMRLAKPRGAIATVAAAEVLAIITAAAAAAAVEALAVIDDATVWVDPRADT
jgi:hypothetical protein